MAGNPIPIARTMGCEQTYPAVTPSAPRKSKPATFAPSFFSQRAAQISPLEALADDQRPRSTGQAHKQGRDLQCKIQLECREPFHNPVSFGLPTSRELIGLVNTSAFIDTNSTGER
jgi:hypothetical protein